MPTAIEDCPEPIGNRRASHEFLTRKPKGFQDALSIRLNFEQPVAPKAEADPVVWFESTRGRIDMKIL